MTDVESGAAVTATDATPNTAVKQDQSPGQRNGGTVKDEGSTLHSAPVPYYNGGAQMKRPPPPQPPPKMFFAPQKYGFFTMNNVEQRWMPGIPPPPFIMPPAPQGPPKDAKRIKFNDEDSDENELFAKLLYKKLKSIASRKRLEILHVSIMEMVRQAQEEDERERGVVNTGSIPAPPPTTT
uniref:FIP-RBD domain-containing protein n=1 Tax=Haemonchus contortus TaxID=6289 RepID=A0A7I4Z598_HAECO